ncbi:MAG: MBL fold metallo-hydrolase [Proteobacteria bacterium]|nr:MBL fold metallo-hydrolase [Pseudomonadota bacterium]
MSTFCVKFGHARGDCNLGTLGKTNVSQWLVALSCLVFVFVGGTESRAESDFGGFKVTLLGTSSPAPRPNRFGPSTLVEAGDQKLLFDAGRGVPIRLGQLKVPIGKVDVLFLTHFHSDHISGIPDLWLTGWLPPVYGRRTVPFRVIGPVGAKSLMSNLERAFALDVKIRLEDEKLPPQGIAIVTEEFDDDGVVFEKNGVKVIAFKVDHGPVVKPAYGYRVEYRGHAIVISGDTRFNQNVIKYGTGVDVLIHSVATAKPELFANAFAQAIRRHFISPLEAGEVFSQAKPKLAVYTHIILLSNEKISEPTIDDLVAETRKTYKGPLEVGEDLMSFEIGDTIKVHPYKQ